MINKSKTILLICVLLSLTAKAQDPHFSQYFSSPLTLNPAMTGYFKGDYRIAANFRQQWRSIGDPFTTSTISYDTKLLQKKVSENDIFAAGVMALSDQSLSGGFKSINVSASFAYHKMIDEAGEDNIGIGFQGTYASRAIDIGKLNFASQFNGSGFDTNLPTDETFIKTRRSYFDVNAGILYTHKTDNNEFYFGGSFYHLTRPNTSFLKNEKFNLPVRFTAHAGSRFNIGENGNELFIGGLFMEQAGATEKNIGIAYGYNVNNEVKVYGGTWYRFGDAILPYFGFSYNDFQLGCSYDITNSSLRNFSHKNGSFELSMKLLVTKPVNYYTNYKGGRIF
jgi:type IX secretion system PorP/SprF family membrane protein